MFHAITAVVARDKLAEIAARRARSNRGGWWRGKGELSVLESQWQRGSGPLQIPPQFVAIRLVTILEVFTRDWVAELIDSGEPYTSRGAELAKGALKIDYAMAQALVGKQVTFGELVSHEIPLNDIGDIDRAFSTLLDSPLFVKLETIVDRWAISDGEVTPSPILPDPDVVRAQIGRLFAARHIIVHELPDDRSIGLENIADFAQATMQFVEATDQYLDHLIHGYYPLTQLEINMAAAESADKADAELRDILARLNPNNTDIRLMSAQAAWEAYRAKQSEFRAGPVSDGGGSMAPMLFSMEMEKVTQKRIEELFWYLNREEGDL